MLTIQNIVDKLAGSERPAKYEQIRQQILAGYLKANQIVLGGHPSWQISEADFEAWQANRRGRGRPKKE